jgi:hypothetical protein
MPREILSTNAPLSAAGSAAQRGHRDEDQFGPFLPSAEADRVRPGLRMVAGGVPIIEPGTEDGAYSVVVSSSDSEGEEGDEDWPEDLPLELLDSASEIGARMEDRGSGVEDRESNNRRDPRSPIHDPPTSIRKPQAASRSESRRPGLKKLNKKQIALDWPPAPRGCEWRRSDDGLNLWRCWTEWDDDKTRRIKKSRYAGHLSDEAWRIMKEYDHEAFISIIGERLRRHSGR